MSSCTTRNLEPKTSLPNINRLHITKTSAKHARQDWELFKVFDSKEEVSESEDEEEYEMRTAVELDGAGTREVLLLVRRNERSNLTTQA